MGKPTGFVEYERDVLPRRPVLERTNDWMDIYGKWSDEQVGTQGARCMDCGVPFCHTGCPLNNVIPHWNDFVFRDRWKDAIRLLHSTNNFPEFTGRLCPAPCEAACVLGIHEPAVSIKNIEQSIVDHAFAEGWIKAETPFARTGHSVAIVGSGPAGLAAAQQLNRSGHWVTVFEKNERIGGLLRFGVPDFKLEKRLLDRRISLMEEEGIAFVTNTEIGVNIPLDELRRKFNAILLCCGSETPRRLDIPGKDLNGIHFALDFLQQQNRRLAGLTTTGSPRGDILATDRRVIIIGGGDTGADCLGTCLRQHARSVHQFEIMPKPPEKRSAMTPWPMWPLQLRTESSHEEGGYREWSIATTSFEGDLSGRVKKLHAVKVGPPPDFKPVTGTEVIFDADLVLIAMGFTVPTKTGLLEQAGIMPDPKGVVSTNGNHETSVHGIFAAGDMRRGQSLVVWAIAEGRSAARGIDRYLST